MNPFKPKRIFESVVRELVAGLEDGTIVLNDADGKATSEDRARMFHFEPYIGALPLRFGMTPAEVQEAAAPPIKTMKNFLGERDELRAGIHIRYSTTTDAVIEMSFLPTTRLMYDSHDLFQEPDLLQILIRYDPTPFEWVGFVIFLRIGLAVTGYPDRDSAQQAITVFAEGRWEAYRDQFALFKLTNRPH